MTNKMQSGINFIRISVTFADSNMLFPTNENVSMKENGTNPANKNSRPEFELFLMFIFSPFPISAFYHHGKNFNSGNEAQE